MGREAGVGDQNSYYIGWGNRKRVGMGTFVLFLADMIIFFFIASANFRFSGHFWYLTTLAIFGYTWQVLATALPPSIPPSHWLSHPPQKDFHKKIFICYNTLQHFFPPQNPFFGWMQQNKTGCTYRENYTDQFGYCILWYSFHWIPLTEIP